MFPSSLFYSPKFYSCVTCSIISEYQSRKINCHCSGNTFGKQFTIFICSGKLFIIKLRFGLSFIPQGIRIHWRNFSFKWKWNIRKPTESVEHLNLISILHDILVYSVRHFVNACIEISETTKHWKSVKKSKLQAIPLTINILQKF